MLGSGLVSCAGERRQINQINTQVCDAYNAWLKISNRIRRMPIYHDCFCREKRTKNLLNHISRFIAQEFQITYSIDLLRYAVQPAESSLMARPPRHHILEPLVDDWIVKYSYGYVGIMQFFACAAMYTVFFPEMLSLILLMKDPHEWTENDYVVYAQGTTVQINSNIFCGDKM